MSQSDPDGYSRVGGEGRGQGPEKTRRRLAGEQQWGFEARHTWTRVLQIPFLQNIS